MIEKNPNWSISLSRMVSTTSHSHSGWATGRPSMISFTSSRRSQDWPETTHPPSNSSLEASSSDSKTCQTPSSTSGAFKRAALSSSSPGSKVAELQKKCVFDVNTLPNLKSDIFRYFFDFDILEFLKSRITNNLRTLINK